MLSPTFALQFWERKTRFQRVINFISRDTQFQSYSFEPDFCHCTDTRMNRVYIWVYENEKRCSCNPRLIAVFVLLLAVSRSLSGCYLFPLEKGELKHCLCDWLYQIWVPCCFIFSSKSNVESQSNLFVLLNCHGLAFKYIKAGSDFDPSTKRSKCSPSLISTI